MTYTNPQTAAALDNLSIRVDAALAAYLTVPSEERVAALATYDGLVDKMLTASPSRHGFKTRPTAARCAARCACASRCSTGGGGGEYPVPEPGAQGHD